jgi:hypothetical protein
MSYFVTKAQASYGGAAPVDVIAIAQKCDQSSQNAVAKLLGYSAATISGIINNTYPGDRDKLLAKARGALLGEAIKCPVLGTIRVNRCWEEQERPFSTSNSTRARLWQACRSGCPHSKVKS